MIYKNMILKWTKQNKRDHRPFLGLGSYTRANAEICIIAKRGKIKILDHSISQLIFSPIEEHSKKPDIVRNKIVQLCGDLPRIELFARKRENLFGDNLKSWDVYGNEVKSDIELTP